MADGTPDRSGKDAHGNTPSPEEAELSARLNRLGDRLSDIRKSRNSRSDQTGGQTQDRQANASAMARGFRLSSELVAGVVVGSVIGWGFDRWLSTSPWGLIVFLMLGFVAGVLNVMRAAGVQQNNSSNGSQH